MGILNLVYVFQDVLDKLSDVGKKDQLLKFFKLVQDGKFPLNNIAFELFLDIVEWFDKDESPPPRKRTKTSNSTPNLKSPSIRAPSLLKNLFQFQNIYILSNGFPHLFGVEDPVKMSLSFFGPDINGVLLLVFVRFLGGDTGNLYRNVFFVKSQCQSSFPLSLESWHLLKVDRE
jgi:hypothetical protein